jgi:cyclophilin family peptidyl-prolyl cis-trans isomerase
VNRFFLLTFAASALGAGPAVAANPVVLMETSLGNIKIELDPEKAPITVKNFLRYVDEKFYDGTIFHRVMAGFMIQGGGFQNGREKDTHEPIQNESANGLRNDRGAIAMARTRELNSATAQFYINLVNNRQLDRLGYCVFGKVIDGMDVVDKIAQARTGIKYFVVKSGQRTPLQDAPQEDILIKSVRRVDASK